MTLTDSIQPRKQHKARYNAPKHLQSRFLTAPLSDDLRSKYGKRRARVVKGDTVKVLRGDFRGQEGLVDDLDQKRSVLFIHGVSVTKADGTEVSRPVNASNVCITKMNMKDPLRKKRFGEGGE
ncbi:MAG: 50S ribosomal protein L24 [Methanomicrobiales archaeon]|nr:50S ribosomal protein L24 [Methanomicrobiales archaeon]